METKIKGTDQVEKDEAVKSIDSLCEILRKHCTSKYDVQSIIISMITNSYFMSGSLEYRDEIIFDFNTIREILLTHSRKDLVSTFNDVTEEFIRAMILAGQLYDGNSLIYQMSEELHEIW